jgi:hypothetical protein
VDLTLSVAVPFVSIIVRLLQPRGFSVGSGLFIIPSDQLFVAAQPTDRQREFVSARQSSRNNPGLGIMPEIVSRQPIFKDDFLQIADSLE